MLSAHSEWHFGINCWRSFSWPSMSVGCSPLEGAAPVFDFGLSCKWAKSTLLCFSSCVELKFQTIHVDMDGLTYTWYTYTHTFTIDIPYILHEVLWRYWVFTLLRLAPSWRALRLFHDNVSKNYSWKPKSFTAMVECFATALPNTRIYWSTWNPNLSQWRLKRFDIIISTEYLNHKFHHGWFFRFWLTSVNVQ